MKNVKHENLKIKRKKYIYIFLKLYIKMEKAIIINFGDIEIEKQKFHQNKGTYFNKKI